MSEAISSGLGWLRDSGIQAEDGGVHDRYGAVGGFNSVTVLATSRFIQAMLHLGDPADPKQREQAIRAGRFLLDRAFDFTTDLFVCEFPTQAGSEPKRKASLAGCAAALQALISLWQATQDDGYRECAARCGRALQTRMSRVDGAYFLSYDLDCQSPDFELDADADQLKLAAAFWRLSQDGGLREFEYPAAQMVRWALTRHEGMLPEWAERKELVPLLERYALFLEGLLPIAQLDPQASHAFQGGLIKLENGVRRANGSSSPQALARLLRLRLYADSLGIIELDHSAGVRERDELELRQIRTETPELDGAFVAPGASEQLACADAESTVVATQALEMWEEAGDGGFREPWQALI